jgi:hypothetical protein
MFMNAYVEIRMLYVEQKRGNEGRKEGRRKEGRKEGRREGRKERGVDGWMEGWMDGECKISLTPP